MTTKLHVGNLESRTTAATISSFFEQSGRQVLSVQLVMSKDPQHSRGFAFVEMGSEADAANAVDALHGKDIDGRPVRVSLAHPPKSRHGGFRRPS